ncbi:trophoblast Kunitz domain protein 1-like [Dama dama]
MRRLCLSAALLVLLVILVDSTPLNIHHIQDEGVETSHKQGLEKRSVLPVVKGILGGVLKGTKIFAKGASILTGLAEIVKKALKGQVMISGIQFDNHTQEELPTLQIEYSTLSEENKGVETSHKRVLEKRSVVHVVKSILGGVIKGLIFLYFWGEERALIFGTSTKIFGKGASILTGLAEIVNKALKVSPTSKPAFCLEPKVTGGCNTMMTRYFYNAQTGLCEQFVYSGCEGNANNFEKLEDCMKTCSQETGSLW